MACSNSVPVVLGMVVATLLTFGLTAVRATDNAAPQTFKSFVLDGIESLLTPREPFMTSKPRGLLGINRNDFARGRGIDTRGSSKPYGSCKGVHPEVAGSHWCAKGGVSGRPSSPLLKYGRQTIYGSSSGGKGWCGVPLKDDPDVAMVAVSTKYIDLKGRSPYSPYCGQCMCIRTVGCDLKSNPHPPQEARKYYGRIFKGKVCDLCPECAADSIDVLGAMPYWGAVPRNMAYGVGVWTVEWQFVDCRVNCKKFFGRI